MAFFRTRSKGQRKDSCHHLDNELKKNTIASNNNNKKNKNNNWLNMTVELMPISSTTTEKADVQDENTEVAKYGSSSINARNSRLQRNKRVVLLASLSLVLLAILTFHHQLSYTAARLGSASAPSHPAFTLLTSHTLPEYNARLLLYQHRTTQAELVAYLPRSSSSSLDYDKSFGIAIRTLPTTSTGVAHILEHSVLNGSRKYPAKDPFLHLLKGSLHTFLNAMTYNDRTIYPVASRNRKDFENLCAVYLDAVFHPNCVEDQGQWVLQQEGWRYDVEGDDDELVYKGVVYSEMKGVYSDAESVLYQKTQSLLFPDNTYHYDSGGDPTEIPNLTHDEFVRFYHQHYHPTNAKFFILGDKTDISNTLDLVHQSIREFSSNTETRMRSTVTFQPKSYSHHIYHSQPYAVPAEDGDDATGAVDSTRGQHLFCITWLLNDKHLDPMIELALDVLDQLLIGQSSSPLNKFLLESRLGTDVIGGGLETGLLQSTFAVGMKGVKGEDIGRLEDEIVNILRKVRSGEVGGLSNEDIEAAMNTIEFSLRELNTGSTPMGIIMFTQVMTKWNYDLHPRLALVFEDALQDLKDEIARTGPAIFQHLIEKYLLDNTHRVHMELNPSTTLQDQIIQEEKNRLKKIKNSLTAQQYQSIIDQSLTLKQIQNTEDSPEVIATIPSLELDDLDRTGVEYPIRVQENVHQSGVTVVTSEVPSSLGIAYVDLGLDVSFIPYNDVELLPLLVDLMNQVGTEELTDEELDRMIGRNTGGISLSFVLKPVLPADVQDSIVVDNTKMISMLFVRGKCTADKISDMFFLFIQRLSRTNLNSKEKAVQILERSMSSLKDNIPSSGHSFAYKRIHSRYNVQSFLEEKLHGVSQLNSLKKMLEDARSEEGWSMLRHRLEAMRQKILNYSFYNGGDTILNLSGDKKVLKTIRPHVQGFVQTAHLELVGDTNDQMLRRKEKKVGNTHSWSLAASRTVVHPWITAAQEEMIKFTAIKDEGIVASTQVSYVGKGGLMYDVGEKVHGSIDVIQGYLETGYLWETVRVKNGAYGVFGSLSISDGSYTMVSYRDPNISLTLDAYDAASISLLADVSNNVLSQKTITTAIIGAIGALDGSALHPSQIGMISLSRWLSGKDAAFRQQWREEILNTSVENFEDFAKRLSNWKSPSIAIVSSESLLDDAIKDGALPLEKVIAY